MTSPTNPLRDMIATVQNAGYVVQEAGDYWAGLRIEFERGLDVGKLTVATPTCDDLTHDHTSSACLGPRTPDAAPETPAEELADTTGGNSPNDLVMVPRELLEDLKARIEGLRQHADDLNVARSRANQLCDEWQDAAIQWEDKYHALQREMTRSTESPHSRVAVFHESDGSVTIRVEKSH